MNGIRARHVVLHAPLQLSHSLLVSVWQESRIKAEVDSLEKDTGVKLRVLCQNYPTTPGLAIRDFWSVDDDTVVFVADPSLGGNILNFNVGGNIDLRIPRVGQLLPGLAVYLFCSLGWALRLLTLVLPRVQNFWTRLSGKYGTKFFWQERGEGTAIVNAVSAIDTCAREPVSKLQCSKIQAPFGEEDSAGPISDVFKKFGL